MFGIDESEAKVVQVYGGNGLYQFRVRMADRTAPSIELVAATVSVEYHYRNPQVQTRVLDTQAQTVVDRVVGVIGRNIKWAELLAASNHGIDLRWSESRDELMSHWFQGLDEGLGIDWDRPYANEGKAIDIMETEINGFLADVIGCTTLPVYWADVGEQLERMEGR